MIKTKVALTTYHRMRSRERTIRKSQAAYYEVDGDHTIQARFYVALSIISGSKNKNYQKHHSAVSVTRRVTTIIFIKKYRSLLVRIAKFNTTVLPISRKQLGMCRIPDNYPVLSGVFCYIRYPTG